MRNQSDTVGCTLLNICGDFEDIRYINHSVAYCVISIEEYIGFFSLYIQHSKNIEKYFF